MITAHLSGIEDVDKALSELPKRVAAGVIRTALKKAGQPVADGATAKAQAHVVTGRLARSFIVGTSLKKHQRKLKRLRGDPKQQATVFVGSTAPHAHFLEFGTVRARAFPILRPVWDALREAVMATIEKELWTALDKAQKRLARRALRGGA